jgi:hypothetical protein
MVPTYISIGVIRSDDEEGGPNGARGSLAHPMATGRFSTKVVDVEDEMSTKGK